MKYSPVLVPCLLFILVTHVWSQDSNLTTTPPANIPVLEPAAEASAWKKIEPRPTLGCRDIMSTILDATGAPGYQYRSAKIEKAFENLESMQDRDPASRTYGNFRWYWRESKPGDLNAVEFVTQQGVILKLLYADRLSSKASQSLDRILKYAVEGIHRQGVNVDYTNIYLMKTWNLLALGQALKRPELSSEGAKMMDTWIAFSRKNGITEFLSPTYLGTDLDSLGLMVNYLTDPQAKGKAEGALRFVWDNIAANWFEPAQRLGGSHGRDYDYLTGHGYLDQHLRDAGWLTSDSRKNPAQPHVFDEACRWSPPPELHQMALTEIPRFVSQRCGTNDFDWASQQIGHHVSIGVVGAGKGVEDKPFRVNIAGPAGPKTVIANFFMDGRNDPYGSKTIPTGASGHMKAHHLDPLFRALQSGSDVLFCSSYPGVKPPPKDESNYSCLNSHLDIPEEAEVWSVDHLLDQKLTTQPIPGNICFLRMGDVAVGIRFLLAEDTFGKPVTAQLISDGHQFNAKRLSVTHSAVPPENGRATVALFVRTEEGLDDAGFSNFRRKFAAAKTSADHQDSVIRLKADGIKTHLILEVDLSTGKILHSEGCDPSVQIPPLIINGKKVDLSTP